jgi:hypothetical protein
VYGSVRVVEFILNFKDNVWIPKVVLGNYIQIGSCIGAGMEFVNKDHMILIMHVWFPS